MSRGCIVNPIRANKGRSQGPRSIRRSIYSACAGFVTFTTRVSCNLDPHSCCSTQVTRRELRFHRDFVPRDRYTWMERALGDAGERMVLFGSPR